MKHQIIGLAAAMVCAIGCAHVPEKAAAADDELNPKPMVVPLVINEPAPVLPGNRCAVDTDCGDGQLCSNKVCQMITVGLAECRQFRVQFGFNAVQFDAGSEQNLQRMARCLRADQGLQVVIEGNADERGTEEYNLQLSSKRATAVEKYLITLGVTPRQVQTVSFGENKPGCNESTESCFATNRRAAVKPTDAYGN